MKIFIPGLFNFRFGPLVSSLEKMQLSNQISSFKITSKNLEDLFNNLNKPKINGATTEEAANGFHKIADSDYNKVPEAKQFKIIKNLIWKRCLHFKRNYRLLLCILVLPTIFEIIAMGFMKLRPPGEHDTVLELSKNLYDQSQEFYSHEGSISYPEHIYKNLNCNENCDKFDSSESAFRWILESHNEFLDNRFGGVSINDTDTAVWYNNKGYHSMPVWLNELNSAMMRAELNDSRYNIKTFNHPLKLGEKELSTSSM